MNLRRPEGRRIYSPFPLARLGLSCQYLKSLVEPEGVEPSSTACRAVMLATTSMAPLKLSGVFDGTPTHAYRGFRPHYQLCHRKLRQLPGGIRTRSSKQLSVQKHPHIFLVESEGFEPSSTACEAVMLDRTTSTTPL